MVARMLRLLRWNEDSVMIFYHWKKYAATLNQV